MKKNTKKTVAFFSTLVVLLTMCVVPAFAEDSSYLNLRISGSGYDYSYFQTATRDNGDWIISLDPDNDRGNLVLKAYLQNNVGDERGYMQVLEGTSNTSGSSCSIDHDYRINACRQMWYDEYATFQGTWDLNY